MSPFYSELFCDCSAPSQLRPADHALQLDDFNYLTFGKRLTDTLEELQLNCIRIDNLDVEEVWRGIELTVKGP